MKPFIIAARSSLWLLVAAVIVYLPGLGGPFLFDDFPNLITPLGDWLHGEIGWQEIVFGNGSGLLGRPLSMLSFLADAAVVGLAPFFYKLSNLLLHLACGWLVLAVAQRILERDPHLQPLARRLALLVAALWLLHPMQVSTVLYVVQRMAQLSALFMLVALLSYLHGRSEITTGRTRAGAMWLFLAVPAATLAAVFSKENGALVPLLCAVIEIGCFRSSTPARSPRAVQIFFLLFLIAPVSLAIFEYALKPELLLNPYAGRTFTFGERLLSEPRALMDYLGALLLPRGPSLGIYTDDFPVSRTLLDPSSTLFAIIGLLTLLVSAMYMRKRLPGYFTGVTFYLAAQAMESSIFPLELYFEHRNYLPSMGFFLALASIGAWGFAKAKPHLANPNRIQLWMKLGGVALFGILGIATMQRAAVWGSFVVLATQGAIQHPYSMRAQMDYANVLHALGDYARERQVLNHLATIANPAAPHIAAINTVALECTTSGETSPDAIANVAGIAGGMLQQFEMLAFQNLANVIEQQECKGLSREQLASIIVSVIEAAPQPGRLVQLWRSRFIAAKLYVQAGRVVPALEQLKLAWATGAADPAVGVFLSTVYLMNHDPDNAELALSDTRTRIKFWDKRGSILAADLERKISMYRQSSRDAREPQKLDLSR